VHLKGASLRKASDLLANIRPGWKGFAMRKTLATIQSFRALASSIEI